MKKSRREHDSLGPVDVPAERAAATSLAMPAS